MSARSVALLALAVTASCGSEATSPRVDRDVTVVSIEILQPSVVFDAIGRTHQLAAVARDAEGRTVSSQTFVWSSSNESVISVTPFNWGSPPPLGMAKPPLVSPSARWLGRSISRSNRSR